MTDNSLIARERTRHRTEPKSDPVDAALSAMRAGRRGPSVSRRRRVVQVSRFLLLSSVAAIWLVPIIGILFTAFKSSGAAYTGSPLAPPTSFDFSNFASAWSMASFRLYGMHSLLITLIKVPIGIMFSAMASFVFSRYVFRGSKILFYVVVAGSMIPLQIALIPMFGMLADLHLLNNYIGLFLVFQAFGIPFEIFLLTAFFNQVPRELDEAARMDGANGFQVFWRIILPLSKPILGALFIFDFVGTFNEFAISLVVLQNNSTWTLPLGLLTFQQTYGNQYNLMSAAVLMASLPCLLVYVFFQRSFVSGLVQGAIRG